MRTAEEPFWNPSFSECRQFDFCPWTSVDWIGWWNVHIKMWCLASVDPASVRTAGINCQPLFSIKHADTVAHYIPSHFCPVTGTQYFQLRFIFRLSRSTVTKSRRTQGHKPPVILLTARLRLRPCTYLDLQPRPIFSHIPSQGFESRGLRHGSLSLIYWTSLIPRIPGRLSRIPQCLK